MKRLTNEQIMDYLEGSLGQEEMARVEAHLASHAEDADLVRSLRFSMEAVADVRQTDEFRVSENFWPQLRDKLGPAPRRSLLGRWSRGFSGAFAPPVRRFSFGAGVAALVLFMGLSMFSPQEATRPAQAEITAADMQFIQASTARHEAFVAAEPVVPGDASVRETGEVEEDDDNMR